MYQIELKPVKLQDHVITPIVLATTSVGIYALIFTMLTLFIQIELPPLTVWFGAVVQGVIFYGIIYLGISVWHLFLNQLDMRLHFKSRFLKVGYLVVVYFILTLLSLTIMGLFTGNLIYEAPLPKTLIKLALAITTLFIFKPMIFKEQALQSETVNNPMLKTYQGNVKIDPDDILFIQYANRKSEIITKNETFVVNMSLSNLLRTYNNSTLLRISRNVAIHQSCIREARQLSGKKYQVILDNDQAFVLTAKIFNRIEGQLSL